MRARAHTHTQKLMQLFYVLNFCDHVTLKFEEFLATVPRLQTKAISRKIPQILFIPEEAQQEQSHYINSTAMTGGNHFFSFSYLAIP